MDERAELAKGIVVYAFRNGPLEDLHAGKSCPNCDGDSSYSKITDAEMKTLMKYAVDHVYRVLAGTEPGASLTALAQVYASAWDDPE